MKNVLTALLLIIGLFFNLSAQKKKSDYTADKILGYSTQAREFWIAYPPNEVPNHPDPILEIYVASQVNTVVTLEYPDQGVLLSKQVKAMETTTFSSDDAEVSVLWEVRESEQVTNKGIRITAPHPISVYVLNGKRASSDGYLAIPVQSWGKKYIHNCYYDYRCINQSCGVSGNDKKWGSGFLIVASENNTSITITLRGIGKNMAKTDGGRDIGDVISVRLNKGETYMVKGNGVSRGVFDLSGSSIISDKPVGLISFHMRATLPSFDMTIGYDHLSEMIPPVTAWGKKYVSVEYKRDTDKGDFFRIIASEPNTKWACKYYDKSDGRLLGNLSGTLKNAGDFYEHLEVYAQPGSQGLKSITGTSVWIADKPVLVCQYTYSHFWDMTDLFDPFMIINIPEEQYLLSTVFQTPSGKFVNNHFNLIAMHDSTDLAYNDLKSIKLDGVPIHTIEPMFLFNRIPTTDLYWARMNVSQGPHKIEGDTKFSGQIYGFTKIDSYGWPAAMNVQNLEEIDTLPPLLVKKEDCGDYSLNSTELRNGAVLDNPRQVDMGIEDVQLFPESFNYKLRFLDSLIPWPPLYRFNFELKVIDKLKPAFAKYIIIDRAGNFTSDSLRYEPDSLLLIPGLIDFKTIRLKTSKTLSAILKNISDSTIEIKSIKLKFNGEFKIISGAVPPEVVSLLPDKEHTIVIQYTPVDESINPNDKDIDSLLIETGCVEYKWLMEGRGVIPKIQVEDWDAGQVVVNNTLCKKAATGTGLKIQNVGSDTLVINDITGFISPFSLSSPYTPQPPIIIPPGGEPVYIEDVCFKPYDTLDYKIDVTFKSNAEGIDSISTLKGRGIISGPYITSFDWKERRVLTVNQGRVFLKNSGNTGIIVNGISLGSVTNDFRITSAVPDPRVTPIILLPENDPNPGLKEITVNVEYEPQNEFTHHCTVVPSFDDPNITPGKIYGNLDGIGILPKIELTGYEFQPQILVGTTHPSQGEVIIKSTSQSADLWIEKVSWKDANQKDFKWLTLPDSQFVLKKGTEIKIPVSFTPVAINKRMTDVEVISDAATGPNENPKVSSTTQITGYAYETGGITVDSINYGSLFLCSELEKTFQIRNISGTTLAVIDSIIIVEGDRNSFEILDTFPKTISPGGLLNVKVRFKPYKVGRHYAIARIFSDIGTNNYSLFEGFGYMVTNEFKLQRWTLDLQKSLNNRFAPGMIIPFDITVSTKDSWNDAQFTEFEIEVQYDPLWMMYSNIIEKGNLLDGTWNISAKEDNEGDMRSLVIKGSGSSSVSASGIIAIPKFQLMLSENKVFEPLLMINTLGAKDKCIKKITEPGLVEVVSCVINLRAVKFKQGNFELIDIDPNPTTGNNALIKFSAGLKSHIKIEIFSSTGVLEALILDSEKEAGKYEALINTSDFPAGIHYVRMISGRFMDIKRMVLLK